MPWRSWQATTLVGALRRLASRGGGAFAERAGLSDEALLEWLGPRPPALPEELSGQAEVAQALRARALAAGVPEAAAEELAELWPSLDESLRLQVAAPLRRRGPGLQLVRWGEDLARQTDGTTCGSACLVMLAAAGDPSLALWLATGRLLDGHTPPEVRVLRRVRPGAVPDRPGRRFAALQLLVKQVSNARALGPLPWPHALGTPPWGASLAARFAGLRFRAEMVDDADRPRTARQLARAAGALAAGIPVPLFSGGDLGAGLDSAVPRHVVLLAGLSADGSGFSVYEPGQAALVDISRREILEPAGPRPALGGWSHAAWIVLPRQ
mgnify:CR=1 FL=1